MEKSIIHDLIWKYHCTKSNAILYTLIKINRGYIAKLVDKYHKRFGCEREDLYQEALMGFMHAVKVFDFDKNCTILTYADFWIRAYMFNFYSQNTSVHIPTYLLRKMAYSNTQIKINPKIDIEKARQAMATLSLDYAFEGGDTSRDLVTPLLPKANTTQILFDKYSIPDDLEKLFASMNDVDCYLLHLLYQGYKSREISELTFIPSDIIETHVKRIRRSLKRKVALEEKNNVHV